ncbi:hypothetical protein G6O69_12815 [Pseudenhygromyxa sp. WMMC2535]|uniref:hypothetical protein n=1 Tax=Pseudenhygromyxa sp. WMMC2535 TaxID=2712867 RepID=UPI0015558894|nr:hypothetical protein [Pseudenhygromyxa sp. WMMC2535]NVB38716.1 hypothetical protein [Pseudenhygromyxa sp. WMMC2535]
MSSRNARVNRIVRGWLVPMVKTLPHRLAARIRDADEEKQKTAVDQLRRRDRPGLIARKSMGFRSLTDMRRSEVETSLE